MRGALALLLLSCLLRAGDTTLLVCGQAAVPPRVDGLLDDDAWNEAVPGRLERKEQLHPKYRSNWTGPGDLSATVRAVRSGAHLYLAFDVRDDHPMHEAGRAWWAGDSIEVFFDSDMSPAEQATKEYSDDDFQLLLMPMHKTLRWGVAARGPERPYPDGGLHGIEVATTRSDQGYTVEARIPLHNFNPLIPDAEGRIGFDVAINDVDEAGADRPESYMTLSGNFDLYVTPHNLGRLRMDLVTDSTLPEAPADGVGILPILLAAAIAIALLLAARRLPARAVRRPRVRPVTLGTALLLGALLFVVTPEIAERLGDGAAGERLDETATSVETVAREFLALDASRGGAGERAERLFHLLRDGRANRIPRYHHFFRATRPLDPPDSSALRYGIPLEPGESRRFVLAGKPAPSDFRLHLVARGRPEHDRLRGLGVEVDLIAQRGRSWTVNARTETSPWILSLSGPEHTSTPLAALRVRNRFASRRIVVEALYAVDEDGTKHHWPLATYSPGGVPFDVWRRQPAQQIVPLRPKQPLHIRIDGQAERLWLAIGATGAYPHSEYLAAAATIRVFYRGSGEPQVTTLRNGVELQDAILSSARIAGQASDVAQRWETPVRQPAHYDLCTIELDPARSVDAIEIESTGVVRALSLAAITMGNRSPDAATLLRVENNSVILEDETRAAWGPVGFRVRTLRRHVGASGPAEGAVRSIALDLGGGESATLEVVWPRRAWVAPIAEARGFFEAAAYLLLCCALLVAGSALLPRARRLRVKMLVVLGAATVVPLLFLFVALSTILSDREEQTLKQATLAQLGTVRERVLGSKQRAHALAARTQDRLEVAAPLGDEAMRPLLKAVRREIDSGGAVLRVPGLDGDGPSPFGNTAAFDAIARTGLYYSAWDGLVALGVSTTARRRYLVAIPARALLGPSPSPEVSAVLLGPDGRPIAGTPNLADILESASGPASVRIDLARLAEQPGALYLPRRSLDGRPVAAAYRLLRDGGRIVGAVGLFHSRAATERALASIRRTLALVGLAALLLVVLAGGTLVDRVTNRLQRVTRAARSIASGNLASRVPIEGRDEVGQLATSFNRMADALDRRMRQLTDLHRGLHLLTARLDPAQVASAAGEILVRTTGAAGVAIATCDSRTGRMETLHAEGGIELPDRLPAAGTMAEAVKAQAPRLFGDQLRLPLVASGRVVGVALCKPVGTLDELELALLDITGRQIGIALENARLYHDAVTDRATGLYTHQFFIQRLKEEIDRAAAARRPLSLLGVALCDLPAWAERFGPEAVVSVTAELGAKLSEILPPRHLRALREPGEIEILVDGGRPQAEAAMRRIAKTLHQTNFEALRGAPTPDLSFRSLCYPEDGASADILLDAFPLAEGERARVRASLPAGLRAPAHLGAIVGKSAPMRALLELVARVAPTDALVLVRGEPGAGKEMVADLLQANSGRRDRPYRKVHCAALSDAALDAELFGETNRIGRIEEAHTGTLLLHEVGAMPKGVQQKLLALLGDRHLQRPGRAAVEIDVRLVATTARDLEAAVTESSFDADLLHRLELLSLHVPPLRERREEIPLLLERFRIEFNLRHRLSVQRFAPDVLDALYAYPWPGNIRELSTVVERSMLLARGQVLELPQLQLEPAAAHPSLRDYPLAEDLTPRQERIMTRALSGGGVTNREVVEIESVSARTALRELHALVERGFLVRIGHRRGAVYRPARR